jgi:tetratricopeptide (TPR) repeat protein
VIARRIRARGLVAGQPPAAVAAAIRDQCGPRYGTAWIRAYRLALGIALTDVVEQVRAWYEHEGRQRPRFSETLLSAYESGQKRPGPEYLHYLCTVYRADPGDLGYHGPCFCGRSHRDILAAGRRDPGGDASTAAPGAGSFPAVGSRGGTGPRGAAGDPGTGDPIGGRTGGSYEDDDDDALRRTLLQLIGGAGIAPDGRFFGAVDGVRRRMDDALYRGTVSATTLDRWEETTASYGRQYMTTNPLRLLCDVLLDFSEVRRMCEERQPIDSEERLCRLAAQLAGLSGMTMINIGDQRLARSFFRTARVAADETGDRCLRAWVAAREAFAPLYYGDPRETVQLARRISDLAGRTPCPAAVMAPILEARALARIWSDGRPTVADRTKRALARGHAAFDALPEDDKTDTAFGYTECQLYFHEGNALAGLGVVDEADRVLEQALRRYPETARLDRSLIRFDRAMCRLAVGEVEEALRIGRDILDGLPDGQRPDIVLHRARELAGVAAARAGDSASVREYQEALAMHPARGQLLSA